MGGSAFAIPVCPRNELVESASRSPDEPACGPPIRPVWRDHDDLRAELEIPGFGPPLIDSFHTYIRRTITKPWLATQSFLESYLFAINQTVNIWAERRSKDQPYRFQVLLHFSGCAGMAQVSSELAEHWADIWYKRTQGQIFADLLGPHGLMHADWVDDWVTRKPAFLPVGEFGYALPTGVGPSAQDEDRPDDDEDYYHFDIDEACRDGDEVRARTLLRELESRWVELSYDGQCRCQLCVPDFDPEELDLPS